ncbi:AAA-like domain protein [compost metagenome]
MFKWWRTKPKEPQPASYEGKAQGVDFAAPSILNEVIPSEVVGGGTKATDYAVEVGGTVVPSRFYRSFFAEIASGNTWSGMLNSLITGEYTNGDVDVAIHISPSSNDRELNEIGRRIAGLYSDLAEETDVRKIDSMRDEIADLKDRQKRIRLNIEKSFRVCIQVIASSTEWKSVMQLCRSLVQRFAGKSIFLRAADGQQLSALKSVLPTCSTNLMKEHYLSLESSNVADLFPFVGGGLNHRSGIILGNDRLGRPVWLDNWHHELTNYHMCIIARSGAGKTYTVMVVIHRSTHIGRRVGIIDWKGEYGDFLMLIGCPYLELHEKSKHRINPYDVDITELADGYRYVDLEEASNSVQALAFKMISVYDRTTLTGEVKVFIGNAIRDQYQELGITHDEESLFVETPIQGDQGQFRVGRQRKPMPELVGLFERMAASQQKAIRKAADMLKPFTRLGNMPSYAIFDGPSTVELKHAPVYGFAINRLDPEIMRPIGLFVAERWMMECWAKKFPDIQKLLVIEESQNIFLDEDFGAIWAESAYREGRATNTGVVSVTQGLEVFTRSQAGMAAIKNSPVKLIGIQESLDIDAVRGKLALTEGEADYLVYQARKGDLVVKVDNQSTIVHVDASPLENMMFTSDPNDPAYQERKRLIREAAAV